MLSALKAATMLESHLARRVLQGSPNLFESVASIIQSGMADPEGTTVEVSVGSLTGSAVGASSPTWWRRMLFSTLEGEQVALQVGYRHEQVLLPQAPIESDSAYIALVGEMLRCHFPEFARGGAAKPTLQSILERALDATQEGVVVHWGDGSIAASNRGAQHILGLSADQLAGKTSADPRWEALDEDGERLDWRRHPAMITLRTGETIRDFVMGVRRADGMRVWVTVNSYPLQLPDDPSGKMGVVATFRDVTAERRDLLRLEMSDAALALLGRSLPDVMISLHAADGTYEYVSPFCEELLGYPPEEILGRSSYDFIHEEDRPKVSDTHQVVLSQPDKTDVRFRLVRKDGDAVSVHTQCQLVRDPRTGAIRGIACITQPTG